MMKEKLDMEKSNQSGRTLLEMVATVSVMAVITLGGMSGVTYVSTLVKVNNIHSEAEEIIKGVTDLYSWSASYPANMMATVCKNEILPRACENDYWKTSDGGQVNVVGSGDTFKVQYTGISEKVCNKLKNDTVWTLASVKSSNCRDGSITLEPGYYEPE